MAIRDENGNIVSLKELKKKQKTPTKKQLEKSLVGRRVWYIEKPSFSLYEGEIISELPSGIVRVKSISRNINNRGEEVTIDTHINTLQFAK